VCLERGRGSTVVLKDLDRAALVIEAMPHAVRHPSSGHETHQIDAAARQRKGARVVQAYPHELPTSHGKLATGRALARQGMEARQDAAVGAVVTRHHGKGLSQAEHLFGRRDKHDRCRRTACRWDVLGCAP
jgi:hypothetical protein